LTRIVERIGGYWYIDYSGDVHLFLSETVTAFPITTAAPRGMAGITNNEDLSQAATRVIARGGGANVVSDVLVGGTTVPVGDISWYAGGGGTVECGPQRITYTGVSTIETGSTTGFVNPPPRADRASSAAAGGSLTAGATYLVAMTYKTAEGETRSGRPVTSSVTLGGAAERDSRPFHFRRADRSEGHPQDCLRLVTPTAMRRCESTRTSPSRHVGVRVAHRRAWAPPTTNTPPASAANRHGGGIDLAPSRRLSQFPSAGWAAAPGDQIFSYTGRSASSGAGTLTGIPASGAGSLTAAVRAGTVKAVRISPAVPASPTRSSTAIP
jgi:hypothetical protein